MFSWPRHWLELHSSAALPLRENDRGNGRSGRRGEHSWPYCDSESYPLVVQHVASSYTDWAIPAPILQFTSGNIPFHSIIAGSLDMLVRCNEGLLYPQFQCILHTFASVFRCLGPVGWLHGHVTRAWDNSLVQFVLRSTALQYRALHAVCNFTCTVHI
jgi:hypothetical protein